MRPSRWWKDSSEGAEEIGDWEVVPTQRLYGEGGGVGWGGVGGTSESSAPGPPLVLVPLLVLVFVLRPCLLLLLRAFIVTRLL